MEMANALHQTWRGTTPGHYQASPTRHMQHEMLGADAQRFNWSAAVDPMLVSSSTPSHGVIFLFLTLSWVLKIDSSSARVVWIFSPFQLTHTYYCFTVDQLY